MAACACLLSGCVSPQKLQKTRADYSTYSTEQRERGIAQRCADAGAMPGTVASLECQMALHDTPPAAKAQSPSAQP